MSSEEMGVLWNQTKRFGYFFYIMDPREHVYQKIDDVPDYYREVVPLYLVTFILEQVIRYYQKKPLFRLNETVSNACHGILMDMSKIPFKGAEVFVYAWVYRNYRLIDVNWDSAWTWVLALFLTDFAFYWMHRITHQNNILWAIHEVHHTPEDMNFTAPMRNHVFLLPLHWFTFLPMALAVPPTTYLVHYQVNVVYQYWLHSEIIDKLPAPIEYILCTPSHHRTHHARNRRYIDKNFGGFLIIWDRLFGTFEEEDTTREKTLFGVTTQMNSFNPLYTSSRHFIHIWKKFREYDTIGHKLSVIFKGPGWSPGKPWLGNVEDIPEPAPEIPKYDPQLPLWCLAYVTVQFNLFLISYMLFVVNISLLSKMTVTVMAVFLSYGCITFGFLLDNSRYGPPTEFLRCILYFLVDKLVFHEVTKFSASILMLMYVYRVVYSLACVMWTSLYIYVNVKDVYKQKYL